jgi:DNA polymerase-3 subunit delta
MVIEVGRRFGLTIERHIAARVAAACGNDQVIVAQELDKLSLYLDASTSRPRQLDQAALDAVGADFGDGELQRLPDLALSGDVAAVADGLVAIATPTQAIPVLRALQRRLLMLAPARARLERGERAEDVMTSMGKSLFWKDRATFGAMLRRWSAADIAYLFERSGKAEQGLLFGEAPEAEALGEELLAVARAARRR